jgi:hypothetical protein
LADRDTITVDNMMNTSSASVVNGALVSATAYEVTAIKRMLQR